MLVGNADRSHLNVDNTQQGSRDPSPGGIRRRSHTVQIPETASKSHQAYDDYDPEHNPVEWIMVTRSDPGGSVPRFLVERGTPASICADAVKFLDWACGLKDAESPETPHKLSNAFRRESITNWHENEHKEEVGELREAEETSQDHAAVASTGLHHHHHHDHHHPHHPDPQTPPESPTSPGILASVADVISAYTPQSILDHLPHHATNPNAHQSKDSDSVSTISSTSFASADSHLGSLEGTNSIASQSLPDASPTSTLPGQPPSTTIGGGNTKSSHEKELHKLAERRTQLEAKFASAKSKLAAQSSTMSEKDTAALKKAEERHEKELKKHEEKYKRELARIEERKIKEAKKLEQKKKKQEDKDEKSRLLRERDEAVAKLSLLEKERELWLKQVGELQKENTTLMQKIGKLEAALNNGDGGLKSKNVTIAAEEGSRSRSSSLLSRKKDRAPLDRTGTGLGEGVGYGAVKSENSSLGA
jgi:hypothetical protein